MTDREKVRKDIKRYENQRLLKGFSTAGFLGSSGLTAGLVGARSAGVKFKGQGPLIAAGAGAAALSGFARGWAKREEGAALGRIKRYYDLRDKPKFINMEAILPEFEKKAVLGESAMLASGLATAAAGGGIAPAAASGGALALDVAALPLLAGWQKDRMQDAAYVAAKARVSGIKNLTPAEKHLSAKVDSVLVKNKLSDTLKPGVRKLMGTFFANYRAGTAAGAHMGDYAGAALEGVNKLSPTLANAALDAMKRDKGVLGRTWTHIRSNLTGKEVPKYTAAQQHLFNEVNRRLNTYGEAGKIIASIPDEVPGLRAILKATGHGGRNVLSEALENPEVVKNWANNAKRIVRGSVGATKALAGLGALGVLSSAAGYYRRKHPLATNQLPATLAIKSHDR